MLQRALAKDEDLHHKIYQRRASFCPNCRSRKILQMRNLISSLIEDKHSSVRRMAISNAAKNKLKLSSKTLDSGLSSSDPSLRSLVATLAVTSGGEVLEKACRDINPKGP